MNEDTQVSTVKADELPVAPEKIEASWTSFVPLFLIFIVFYFFLIRPQEKKRKEMESLIASVKKGEEVLTSGGIAGKVAKVSESDLMIHLEVADNVIIKVAKSAIVDITSRKTLAVPVATKEETKTNKKSKKTKA